MVAESETPVNIYMYMALEWKWLRGGWGGGRGGGVIILSCSLLVHCKRHRSMWPQSGRHIEGASGRRHKTCVWPLTHCKSRCWFHGGRETGEDPTPFEALQERPTTTTLLPQVQSSRINTGLYECGHPSRYYIYNHVQPGLTWSLVVKDNTLTAHAIHIFTCTNIFNYVVQHCLL